MKQNAYEIEKNLEKIYQGSHTGFLTKETITKLKNILKKEEYEELIPNKESEKTILYKNKIPKIKLYKINCSNPLEHSKILGSLFALNITSEVFGDIIKYNNTFYIYLLESISPLIETELTQIDKYKVKLTEVPLNTLDNYQRNYKTIETIVSSLRIDTIVSKLIGTNREKIKELIKDKALILNYEPVTKIEHKLKENDIFSIKKYGKYHFKKIIGKTKKENYIIEINKYI